MAKKLEHLNWKPMWASHVGCVKGCLDFLGHKHSAAWVSGGTGHAFVLNVSADLCPSGPTTWDPARFLELIENLGGKIERVRGLATDDDFHKTQIKAMELVKLAINAGYPCYGWELYYPEYYVVYGYDKTHYYFKGPGFNDNPEPKRWMELGLSDIGVLEMYAMKPREVANDVSIVRNALGFAVEYTRTDRWVFAGAGRKGYDNWITALAADEPHSLGTAYNAAVWHECRHLAVEFLKEARERLSDDLVVLFAEAIKCYEVIRDNLKKVTEQFPFEARKPEHVRDPQRKKEAIAALKKARDAEESGLKSLQKIVDAL